VLSLSRLGSLPAHAADGQQGIKAIILYPMNALAADQEKRFAEVVGKNAELRTAGIRVAISRGAMTLRTWRCGKWFSGNGT